MTCVCRGGYHMPEQGQLVYLAPKKNAWWRHGDRGRGTRNDFWRLERKVEHAIGCSPGSGPFLYLARRGCRDGPDLSR